MDDTTALAGRTIAVPETRQLEVLAALLEKRGAAVIRCPLVAIRDSDDEPSVLAWIERFVAAPPDVLILYTGEGVNRLIGFAERAGTKERFVAALAHTPTLTRGPKPKRALRSLGLAPAIEAPEPTTAGILVALDGLALDGKRAGVQLHGGGPAPELITYLERRGVAADYVAPYIYATAAEDERVALLIERLSSGEIDAIAFTSKSQVERLVKLAHERGLNDALERGLAAARIAAVGPVVAAELAQRGYHVDAVPAESFHMKPLVQALVELFSASGPSS